MTRYLSIRVFGKVQGVFFRQSAAAQAKRLGITGLIRNEPNGTVYLEVEGSPDAINTFLDWCTHGPPSAHVKRVQTQRIRPRHFETFTIERTKRYG